jgi:hypothetical protein
MIKLNLIGFGNLSGLATKKAPSKMLGAFNII